MLNQTYFDEAEREMIEFLMKCANQQSYEHDLQYKKIDDLKLKCRNNITLFMESKLSKNADDIFEHTQCFD